MISRFKLVKFKADIKLKLFSILFMVTVIIYMVFSFNNSSAQSNSSILIENELEKVYKPSGPDVDVFIEGTFQNDNLRGGPGN